MAEIYNRLPLEHNGTFSADAALVTFGNGVGAVAGVGLLTQQVNWQYAQQITRLYEVGTRKTYYIVGRTQGNAGLARVLGPRPVALAFYAVYGDACRAGTNTLNFSASTGCDPAAPGSNNNGFNLTLTGVVIQSVSGAVRAEDMLINEQLALMFIALLI